MESLEEKIEKAIWIGKSLFDRNKVSGSSANMSFMHLNETYITGSGTCFGNLKKEDFALVNEKGEWLSGPKPSKELPLHRILYSNKKHVEAVIHTHSFYSTLWSGLPHSELNDCVPKYTPYLEMKVGRIGLVDYAPPGSLDLFSKFEQVVNDSEGFLLRNHGPVIGGQNLMEAFYAIEELEESVKIAWHYRTSGIEVSRIE
jgi:ribulose-5-phosphate 4-epimerase/fuculose-1-phosphate aldolase